MRPLRAGQIRVLSKPLWKTWFKHEADGRSASVNVARWAFHRMRCLALAFIVLTAFQAPAREQSATSQPTSAPGARPATEPTTAIGESTASPPNQASTQPSAPATSPTGFALPKPPLPPALPPIPPAMAFVPSASPATQLKPTTLSSPPPMTPLLTTRPSSTVVKRESPSTLPATAPSQVGSKELARVVVTSDFDAIRDQISPSLGAVTYTIGPNQIETTGQGENATFQQVLLHAPGVVQEEFGEVHVRGDHGDLQYRINGVILPEQLNGFGQEIDTRLISSVKLMDGTLPAQFGDRTAGIFDITTKTGSQLNGSELSLYGGSYDTFQPSFSWGGTSGKLEYFVSASYKQNNLGIDNTTSSTDPLHDRTEQTRGFGYFSYRLDDTSRVTLLLSASYANFQIPDIAGVTPRFALLGNPTADSAATNDHQNEQSYYSVLSYLTSMDNLSLQVSAFTRYTDIKFTPDPVQDLLFDGVAAGVTNNDWANGVQADASYILDDHHTLRFGALATYDIEQLDTNAAVFSSADQFMPDVPPSPQSSDQPFRIDSNGRNTGLTSGVYLQDEWQLTNNLTVNYGLRYDRFDTNFDTEDQVSPRVNLVWKINKLTTFHAGYARYFMPPTLQYISPATIKEFEYTTDAPFNEHDDAQKAERDNYFDVGLSRQITPAWQVNVDSFCKLAKNLLDDGQFGNAVILNNFNYTKGTIYGAELSTTFKQGDLSEYANFSYVQTWARNVDSAQYEFPSNELAYIAKNYIQLDHQQLYTASVGASYTILKNTRVYADFLFGDGLRAGFANLEKLPAYYPLNVGVEHVFHTGSGEVKLRLDCLNVFDEVYEIRNGTGLGIAAPAYGPRRGFYCGLSYQF